MAWVFIARLADCNTSHRRHSAVPSRRNRSAPPGRVAQWIAAHGDPRTGSADLVDWIERIPYDETRDYVERVSENLSVYRQRLADERPAPTPMSLLLARE
jgi:hypothetical protein